MIGTKYGKETHGWRSREARGLLGVGLWKEILKEAAWFGENWKFRIHNGARIRFEIDHWHGSSVFSLSFPTLFKLVANKQETMALVWD